MGANNSRESTPLLDEGPTGLGGNTLRSEDPERLLIACRRWVVASAQLDGAAIICDVQALAGDQLLVSTTRNQLLVELPSDPRVDGKFCRLFPRAGHRADILKGRVAVDTHRQAVWTLGSHFYHNTKAVFVGISPDFYLEAMASNTAPAAVADMRYFYYSHLATNQRGDLVCFNSRMNRIDCFFRQFDYGFSLFFGEQAAAYRNTQRAQSAKASDAEPNRAISQLHIDMLRVYALDGITNTLWIWLNPDTNQPARFEHKLQLPESHEELSFGVTDSGTILVYAPKLAQLDAYSPSLNHLGTLFTGLMLPDGRPLPPDCRLVVDHQLRLWLYSRERAAPGSSAVLLQLNPNIINTRSAHFQNGDTPFPLQRFDERFLLVV
jgi:hypothetical protein